MRAVHDQHRHSDRAEPRHDSAHRREGLRGCPCANLAVIVEGIRVVAGDLLGVSAHRRAVQCHHPEVRGDRSQNPCRKPLHRRTDRRVDGRAGQQQAGHGGSPAAGHVVQCYQPAQTVPEQEHRQTMVLHNRAADQFVQVGPHVCHSTDVGARSGLPAMPVMVQRVNGVAGTRESLPDMDVPAAVFGQAVGDHDHTERRGRKPRLPIDFAARSPGERAVIVLNHAWFFRDSCVFALANSRIARRHPSARRAAVA